jgi:hypothetical protein
MSYGDYLKDLLRPFGLYRLEGTVNGAELECYGAELDVCAQSLEDTEREMNLVTAQDFGLENYLSLLLHRPVGDTPEELAPALAALLRIGTGSFTLSAINDNLSGCGVEAVVAETEEKGVVEVTFPHLYFNQKGLEQMMAIVGEIVPCHLEIRYRYWDTSWSYYEENALTWGQVADGKNSWLTVMVLGEKSN